MSRPLRPRVVGDLSGLPDYAFGPKSLMWWGTTGFMLIEGTGFLVAGGAYFYLMGRVGHWPPGGSRPPDLLWGTLFTLVLLLSEIPNVWTGRQAKAQRLGGVRLGTWIMFAVGALLIAIRAVELGHLNERWDKNAYGSIIWTLMLLHTLHVVTDVYDTGVLGVVIYTNEVDGRRYSDISDNVLYWHFVVLTWLPIYLMVYWIPRWRG